MSINLESLKYNRNQIYPLAGYEFSPGAGLKVTSDTTLKAGRSWLILADTTAAPFSVFLPAAPLEGNMFLIVDNGPNGSFATNSLTIDGAGKSINGAGTLVLNANFAARLLRYNGTQWVVLHRGLA